MLRKIALLGIVLPLFLALNSLSVSAQINPDTVKAGEFDMGKMWTFDVPPSEFFSKTYGFDANEKWFEEARLSAIRFASWCSSSFVSADGLVMTNHHCARESGTAVQKAGENFNDNGFFAKTLKDERKVPELYVDQLVKILDITARMQAAEDKGADDAERTKLRRKEQEAIIAEYKEKTDWLGLEVQVVRFYSGGRYSLYGFKRYNDVRLVFMPELQLGFYGGDYDNFTYPRYALDCSFFRVYDDAGKPLKTEHYYRFNPKGAAEGEAVFVVGNPGTTNRLNTISDLEYRRDVQLPTTLSSLKARSALLKQYNLTAKSDSILNEIFSLENSIKAITGIHNGTKDPYLMARKGAFERDFRAAATAKNSANGAIWDDIAGRNAQLRTLYPKVVALFSTDAGSVGQTYAYACNLVKWATAPDANAAGKIKSVLEMPWSEGVVMLEEGSLAIHLQQALDALGKDDPYVKMAFGKATTAMQAAKNLIRDTKLVDPAYRAKLIGMSAEDLAKENDPLISMAMNAVPRGDTEVAAFRKMMGAQQNSRALLGRKLYEVYGSKIPPDATFSLRINDGVVAGYSYNGTIAPPFTTYNGLFDRYQSFKKTNHKDWNLPARWTAKAPTAEFLNTPMNFVTTNDIIGGNSGSPIINQKLEVVGLIFDGNMESLPGEFIYTPDVNRSVAVHAGGMMAAIKHVYKAKRLYNELLNGKL